MKISEILVIPKHVLGFLDWFSGLLFINEPFPRWQKIASSEGFASAGPRGRLLAQTVTHETYHFLQITTCGYLYVFASRLFVEMGRIILRDGPLEAERLERLAKNPPAPSEAVIALFGEIDRPGPAGVSVRAIVESAAYLYELRTHLVDLDDDGFQEILRRDPLPIEYRLAYDVLREACGAAAFANLLPLCLVALCFARPEAVYPELIAEAVARGLHYRGQADLRSFLQLAMDLQPRYPVLGTAGEVAAQWSAQKKQQHPIYFPGIAALNELAERISPLLLMVEPGVLSLDHARALVQPIRLNDGYVILPPVFEERYGASAEDQALSISIMAAVAHGILNYKEERVPS